MSARDTGWTDQEGGDDALAAEYVLGVLAAPERAGVERRREDDRAFAARVEAWEARLAPLSEGYDEREAPARVKDALERRLFGTAARWSAWTSLNFWRGLSGAALAAFALALALPLLSGPADAPRPLVAALGASGGAVQYVALLDRGSGQVALSHLAGEREADRDFELWTIVGAQAPVAVGVIPAGRAIRIELSDEALERLAAGAVLAISLEPKGGSPTGQPTGPVVATGDLRAI